MHKLFALLSIGLLNLAVVNAVYAENYTIDKEGAHAFIQFKIKHLGYSWLYGQFKQFSGTFSYDKADPSISKITVDIDVASIDSNHAKRDKHLRGKDFLDVANYPESSFTTTSFEELGDGKAILKGDFTLHGVTKNIAIDIEHIGHGNDPWGGYRRGFYGTTTIKPAEFGLKKMAMLGPSSAILYLELSIEGIRESQADFNPLERDK